MHNFRFPNKYRLEEDRYCNEKITVRHCCELNYQVKSFALRTRLSPTKHQIKPERKRE